MLKKMLIASAISAAFATTPSIAQQMQAGGQQNTFNQTWAQEQSTGQGTQVFLGTSAVRQIQQQLNQAGYDVGDINGTWNNQTARAVADYQRTQGLEPTGTLTLSLINSLGMQNLLNNPQQTTGGGGQGNQAWAQEQATGVGAPIYISPAEVRQIQQELNKRGYDVGQVDGQWNQQTVQAVRDFQRSAGLEPNGKPDVNLIAALGGTQEIFSGGSRQASGGGNMQWAQETASGPGVPLWVSPATVRHIQQGLNNAGYDAGQVDGQWAQETVEAVMDFQRANGLEPTGTLTTNLLSSIGQANWTQGQTFDGQQVASGFQQQQGNQQPSGQQQSNQMQSNQMQGSQSSGSQGGQIMQGSQSSGSQGGQMQSSQSGCPQGGQQQQSGQQQGGQSSGGQGGQQQGGQSGGGLGYQQQGSNQGQQQQGFSQGFSNQQGGFAQQNQQQAGFRQDEGFNNFGGSIDTFDNESPRAATINGNFNLSSESAVENTYGAPGTSGVTTTSSATGTGGATGTFAATGTDLNAAELSGTVADTGTSGAANTGVYSWADNTSGAISDPGTGNVADIRTNAATNTGINAVIENNSGGFGYQQQGSVDQQRYPQEGFTHGGGVDFEQQGSVGQQRFPQEGFTHGGGLDFQQQGSVEQQRFPQEGFSQSSGGFGFQAEEQERPIDNRMSDIYRY